MLAEEMLAEAGSVRRPGHAARAANGSAGAASGGVASAVTDEDFGAFRPWTWELRVLLRLCRLYQQPDGQSFDSEPAAGECTRALRSPEGVQQRAAAIVASWRAACRDVTTGPCAEQRGVLFPEEGPAFAARVLWAWSLLAALAAGAKFLDLGTAPGARRPATAGPGRGGAAEAVLGEAAPAAKAARGDPQRAPGTEALTGFRACISLWVWLEHAGIQFATGGSSFVVLSGCVLSLSRRGELGAVRSPFEGVRCYARFFYLRVVRILPLYWFVLATQPITAASVSGLHVHSRADAAGPLSVLGHGAAFFVRGILGDPAVASGLFDHRYWFIGVIIKLYALFPLLERALLGRPGAPASSRWLLGLAALLATAKLLHWALYVALLQPRGYGNGYYCVWAHVPAFCLGMLVPHLEWRDSPAWLLHCSDVLGAGYVAWAFLGPVSNSLDQVQRMNAQCGFTALLLWSFCFGRRPSLLGRFLTTPWLLWLGRYSYGIYLSHYTLLCMLGVATKFTLLPYYGTLAPLARSRLPADYALAALAFLLAIAKAWVGHHLVEQPCSRLARAALTWAESAPQLPPQKGPDSPGSTSVGGW